MTPDEPTITPRSLVKVCRRNAEPKQVEQEILKRAERLLNDQREIIRASLLDFINTRGKSREKLTRLTREIIWKMRRVFLKEHLDTSDTETDSAVETNPDVANISTRTKMLAAISQFFHECIVWASHICPDTQTQVIRYENRPEDPIQLEIEEAHEQKIKRRRMGAAEDGKRSAAASAEIKLIIDECNDGIKSVLDGKGIEYETNKEKRGEEQKDLEGYALVLLSALGNARALARKLLEPVTDGIPAEDDETPVEEETAEAAV